MKILQIHNKYQQHGGEDVVLKLEHQLLVKNGNIVEQILFDNDTINSRWRKLTLFYNALYNYSSAKKLRHKIKSFQPDIIHVHNFFPLASPAIFIAASKLNIPIILTLHNYRLICANAELIRNNKACLDCVNKVFPMDGIKHSCYRSSKLQSLIVTLMSSSHKLLGTWQDKIDGYIALTNYSKNLFLNSSLKINKDKIFIKPNFINIYDLPEIKKSRGDNYLFVGRLINSKGLLPLLKATEIYNFKLTIIGDGPLRDEVIAYSKKNPLITYEGFQSQEYILNKLSECRALIFPSIKIEGFPVTIVESFSVGTPVISSNAGPLTEIIQDNVNGYIYENTEQLIDILKKMDQDIQVLNYLYVNAQKSFKEFYGPDQNYNMLYNIYKTVIEKKASQINN